MNFEEFGLDPLVLDALRALGYTTPTEVQAAVIPLILQGDDVLALAETGSGKTATNAIPLCHKVDVKNSHIQGLIIVPTRELALQYAEESQKIGKYKGVKVFALFGGEDMDMQRAKLKHGVHILVATPGRLIDFIYQRAIDLSHVKTVALDEADEMLGMGFLEDLEFIMGCMMQEHQTLLLSATMPAALKKIAGKQMRSPKEVLLIGNKPIPENLKHAFYFCKAPQEKTRALITFLQNVEFRQALIFVNSRREAEKIHQQFRSLFSSCDFLHGGLDQNVRTIVTGKFSKGKIQILVATDVASRGLDFSGVTHVVNLHFPEDREIYLHRAGRTARQGREGSCVTFVTSKDLGKVRALLESINREPIWLSAPPKGRN